ncbi:hypothetical protein C2845_PM01G36130 [Panicum miliaceum]|uniref:Myb-like domain-containing protein n=1 Tax=Panicum miliaceum TaxID=4540 RepID=A0A3L6TH28_PANMI|nr:hypothetical protein C2845_PM01G36130 [Panicum miliaceum]
MEIARDNDVRPPNDFMSYFGNEPHNFHLEQGGIHISSMNRPLATNNDSSPPPEVDVRTEKRILWTVEEDVRVMSSWIEHSTDSTCGADKGGNQYWGEVVESYNKTTPPLRRRNLKLCKDRWHKINRWTDLFECAYVKARRVFTSGYSDQMWIDAAHKFYVEDSKDAGLGPFLLMEVWKICREVSKWKTCNEQLRNTRKRKSFHLEGGSQENEEPYDEMPKRPMGQKAAKKAALDAKGKSKGMGSDESGNSKKSAIDLDKLGRYSKFQEETNEKRLKILEVQQKLSSEKLEATKIAHLTAQENKEGKKLEKESKMMEALNKDTSAMSDEEKAERVAVMNDLYILPMEPHEEEVQDDEDSDPTEVFTVDDMLEEDEIIDQIIADELKADMDGDASTVPRRCPRQSGHLEILKWKLDGSSLENAEKRIKKLSATFLYCISDLGVWLAAKAAEVLQSYKGSCLSFWGEKLDEQVEGFVRNYAKDVYNDLSETISKMTKRGIQRHIGEDFAADLQDGLLTSKVHFLIKSLLGYRYFKPLPRFDIDKALGACTLHLPMSSPVQTVYAQGEVSVLKQVVCLKACRELHAIGALTNSLLPELTVLEDEPDIGTSSRNAVDLPPELCRVVMSPLSARALYSFSFIPSIMYRIQCMLLSVKLKNQLGPRMQQFDIPALKGYIRSEPFNLETWIIPGLGYDTCGSSKITIISPNMYSLRKLKPSIKSKRIADSVEALIGAYLSASGEQAAYIFLKSLGMDIEFHNMPVGRKVTIKSEEFINLRSLEETLYYNFNDPSLLVEALTHGSYQIAGTTACYQRLEFLGDAVLDHIFTDYFYHRYPESTPELLTDLRSASVNNYCYAHAAVKAGLHKHVLHSSSALYKRMADYLDTFEQSFSGPSYGWEAGIGLPKVLGDVIESIAGAIYVDSKCDQEIVWRSMKRLLEPLVTPDTMEMDPVKELQEFCDSKAYSITYTVTHDNRVSSVVAEVQPKGLHTRPLRLASPRMTPQSWQPKPCSKI